MPLDPLQDQIARTALSLPQARTLALASGGALLALRLTAEDWAEDGIDPNDADRLRATFDDWRERLIDGAS